MIYYKIVEELPADIRDKLPLEAQDLYMRSYNSALRTCMNNENTEKTCQPASDTAAWVEVKKKYKKDSEKGWILRKAQV